MKKLKEKKSPRERLPVVIQKRNLEIDPLMPETQTKPSHKLSPKGMQTFAVSKIDLNRFATVDSKRSPLALAAEK